jgi:hypothetical protein
MSACDPSRPAPRATMGGFRAPLMVDFRSSARVKQTGRTVSHAALLRDGSRLVAIALDLVIVAVVVALELHVVTVAVTLDLHVVAIPAPSPGGFVTLAANIVGVLLVPWCVS